MKEQAHAVITGALVEKKRKSTNNKQKKTKCSRQKCTRTGAFTCTNPVPDYCENLPFCDMHHPHKDHTGEGSSLKTKKRKSNLSSVAVNSANNNLTEVVNSDIDDNDDADDDDDDDDDADDDNNFNNNSFMCADICCAVIECGRTNLLTICHMEQVECKNRKFCDLHGPKCSQHAFQTLTSNPLEINNNKPHLGDVMINEINNPLVADVYGVNLHNDNKPVDSNDAMITEEYVRPLINSNNEDFPFQISWQTAVSKALDLNKVRPITEEEFATISGRFLKIGLYILVMKDEQWRITEIRSIKTNNTYYLEFRDNLNEDKWIYLDLELNNHGRSNMVWVALISTDKDYNTNKRRKNS